MDRTLVSKTIIVGSMIIAICLALGAITGIIQDRAHHRLAAQSSIETAWAGRQRVTGPLLILPIEKSTTKTLINPHLNSEEKHTTQNHYQEIIVPEILDVSTSTKVEKRYRGIYSFPVYTSTIILKGHFDIPEELRAEIGKSIQIGKTADLEVSVCDARGFADEVDISWGNDTVKSMPGVSLGRSKNGVHAKVDLDQMQMGKPVSFEIRMTLKGLDALRVSAVGKESNISMVANWADPKFVGSFLPTSREIDNQSFKSEWQLSYFATGLIQSLETCNSSSCNFNSQAVGFELFEPLDLYHLTERSLKYGVLFIVLTFASFFMFEILKSLQIHPVQYAFVGAMQSVFYLLLLSLSEHVSFTTAYILATASCVVVIGFYLRSVLKSAKDATRYVIGFTLLYTILYFVLRSQDFALLLGTIVLFGVLSGLMILTRNVDWYSLQKKSAELNPATSS